MRIELNKDQTHCPFGRKLKEVSIHLYPDFGGEDIINVNYGFCPECQYFVYREFYNKTSYTRGYVICKHTTLKDKLALAKELIK
jgi:hypothetical protein